MTDLEFLQRLQTELRTGDAWRDIANVEGMAEDAELAENELRVYSATAPSCVEPRSRFRVIVAWETVPHSHAP